MKKGLRARLGAGGRVAVTVPPRLYLLSWSMAVTIFSSVRERHSWLYVIRTHLLWVYINLSTTLFWFPPPRISRHASRPFWSASAVSRKCRWESLLATFFWTQVMFPFTCELAAKRLGSGGSHGEVVSVNTDAQ